MHLTQFRVTVWAFLEHMHEARGRGTAVAVCICAQAGVHAGLALIAFTSPLL